MTLPLTFATGLPRVVPRLRWLRTALDNAALASGNAPLVAGSTARWTCNPRVAVSTPGEGPAAVRGGRYFAAGTARRWGMAERADDVAVVASELLTNALRHAAPADAYARPGNGVRLGLLQPGPSRLLCAVADEDPHPPVPVSRDPEDFAETGRGLHIIAALSDDWGYAILGDAGKVVWALFSAVQQLGRP